ncbi:flagellar hook protein FlgE [Citricoccus sp. I39-566]|uniref:flagellar hook protein FlgE n=1 Tax=Citricoccus sp. I39-566 TaxID=3073268 RepID=UPI00286B1171|nr:flagellar hook protein FlgE [Citricoccus sp. I39-566]WMY77975.1 flagellar hook protein FlgE [Citricoccus sp. I39-566]
MLRSLNTGVSGMSAHQQMLDVTANNIANVNTTGFKAATVTFQDTLSQMTQNAGAPGTGLGGTNPAQVGLGVRTAAITTDHGIGAMMSTGKATDLMIGGEGYFVVSKGGEQLFTRAGSFNLDASGNLVTPDGAQLNGWTADAAGNIRAGAGAQPLTIDAMATAPARATTSAQLGGNLPDDAEVGDELVREVTVYDATGNPRQLSLTFTRTAGGWGVAGTDGAGATGTGSVAFTNGTQGGAANVMNVGGITVDLASLTGYATMQTATFTGQDGAAAGTIVGFSIAQDGTINGTFSNGDMRAVGQVAIASFDNPAGLEKVGSSAFRATVNSGVPTLGAPGDDGFGPLAAGTLEGSNTDLSKEFTNLIMAQRGFQASARIVTTSDEVLSELTNLKR